MSSYIQTEQYGRDDEVVWLSSWKGLVTKPYEFPQSAGTTLADGRKIIKSGTVYKITTSEPASTTYLGIVFGDVDVTKGAGDGRSLFRLHQGAHRRVHARPQRGAVEAGRERQNPA